jgi:hypothetical protein
MPTPQPTVPTPTSTVEPATVVEPMPQPTVPTPTSTVEPATNNLSTSPPLDTSTPVTPVSPMASSSSFIDPTLSQSSQEESSNISSQIQDFLNPTPADSTTSNTATVTTPPLDTSTPQPSSPPQTPVTSPTDDSDKPEYNFVNIANKKSIAPDPAKPDINSLLAKEEVSAVPQTGQVITSTQTQDKNQIDPNSIAL